MPKSLPSSSSLLVPRASSYAPDFAPDLSLPGLLIPLLRVLSIFFPFESIHGALFFFFLLSTESGRTSIPDPPFDRVTNPKRPSASTPSH